MSPSTQFDLLAALGYAVLERIGEGSFRLLGTAPRWLPDGEITEAFPFLELFLEDAEEYWAYPGGRHRLSSDLWTQASDFGAEMHFRAVAIAADRSLLLIERVDSRFHQAQAFVQYAHETKLAEEQIAKLSHELERATEAKSEFLARMSHEIRTPMNSLLGMAELLAETPLNTEQREYVRIFRRAGDNLLNVINDILDFSKIEAGQIELERVGFNLRELVQDAIDIVKLRAQAKGLELSFEISAELHERWLGDPGRLRQILLNLLSNAIKFTERGAITVSIDRTEQGELHFRVGDTGIGIPSDRISTIFDSFTQADSSTTRKYGGTGLGLAISKKFVVLMGGRIWAESAPGAGSTVHFILPLALDEAPKPEVQAPSEVNAAALALRILLADDSEDNRFLIRGYLRGSACSLDEVENGAEAVDKFKHGGYDLVLIDSEMPVMDGYSAVRLMRIFETERGQPATPVLALTAHAFAEARDRSLAAGCTDHLTKPIAKATLLEAIWRHALDRPAAAPIPVEVADWLKPVVPGYLEKRHNDVALLKSALMKDDYAAIRTLGHQMAGSGAGYGFDEITVIGAELEESALARDGRRIVRAIEALDRFLRNLVTR